MCSHCVPDLSPTTGQVAIRVAMHHPPVPQDSPFTSIGINVDDDDGIVVGDSMLEFSVEDNGPGIPPEDHASVFTPSCKRRFNSQHGSGLSLSIAEQLVKLHGAASMPARCRVDCGLQAAASLWSRTRPRRGAHAWCSACRSSNIRRLRR